MQQAPDYRFAYAHKGTACHALFPIFEDCVEEEAFGAKHRISTALQGVISACTQLADHDVYRSLIDWYDTRESELFNCDLDEAVAEVFDYLACPSDPYNAISKQIPFTEDALQQEIRRTLTSHEVPAIDQMQSDHDLKHFEHICNQLQRYVHE